MQCPHCEAVLSITERKGVEIDYCPKCRGVWLDAGELDKILERSSANDRYENRHPEYREERRRQHDEGGYRREEKRESWLERVFDIFD
jgi:Zn-finger nucleic acid-binding protein